MNRLVQRMPKTKTCKSCLLPDTYPGVRFNNDGICNFCVEYTSKPVLGAERFLELVSSRKGDTYDCLLGLSGGKDSSYVAYLAKKKFGLRALAVCYDFPFLVDLARENIQRLCTTLDLDLNVVKSNGNIEYKLVREHFLSVMPTGTTWGQCLFCHYGIDGVLYNTAVENNIPFILGGVTVNEKWWNPGSRTNFLMARVKKLPLSDKLNFVFHQLKAYSGLAEQRKQFSIPGNSRLNVYKNPELPLDGPVSINVFDYIPWDYHKIETILREETGWTKPDRAISWRYDCIMEPLLDYTYLKEFGISTVGLYLSSLIRQNLITREEAEKIQQASEDENALRNDAERVFDFLSISDSMKDKFFNG